MKTKGLCPVVMPTEVVIFAGSEPAKEIPRFPTEEEAWEYLRELEESKKDGDDDEI